MRKDKIVKIVMSAAVMASMAAGPVKAEELEGETIPENMKAAGSENIVLGGPAWEPGITTDFAPKEPGDVILMKQAQEAGHDFYQVKIIMENGLDVEIPDLKSLILEEPVQETSALPYTDEDLYILAHAICGEGQCCPDEEQLYIGSVILNRRNHWAYPNTIKGVVFQKGQYACTWDGNYDREPTEANWRNARWLLENGSILPANVVYQAGFRQGKGVYLQTRYHKYCYR